MDDENGFLGVGVFGGLVVVLDDERFLLGVHDEDGFLEGDTWLRSRGLK